MIPPHPQSKHFYYNHKFLVPFGYISVINFNTLSSFETLCEYSNLVSLDNSYKKTIKHDIFI